MEKINEDVAGLLDAADILIAATKENIQNVTHIRDRLRNSSYILERREGILYDLNPLYRTKYVKPAQQHAQQLMDKARHYQG